MVALENDPQFNAGRGSALTEAGTVEMDAVVVDGNRLPRLDDLACGANARAIVQLMEFDQRVDQRDAFAPELSSLAGEVELAGATLAAWPSEAAIPGR